MLIKPVVKIDKSMEYHLLIDHGYAPDEAEARAKDVVIFDGTLEDYRMIQTSKDGGFPEWMEEFLDLPTYCQELEDDGDIAIINFDQIWINKSEF